MKRPVEIACFSPYPIQGPSARHRIYALAKLWGSNGMRTTIWSFMGPRLFSIRRSFSLRASIEKTILFFFAAVRIFFLLLSVRRFDAVVIHREMFPLGPPLLEKLLCRIHPIVFYDLDDAIWYKPSNEVNQRALFWDPHRVSAIMRSCTAVIVSNNYLYSYARKFAKDTIIIPTTCDDFGGRRSLKNDKPVIVWIGNLGNAEYLSIIKEVVEQLGLTLSFTLRIIGGEDIFLFRPYACTVEYHRWEEQNEADLLSSADIGIMPLYNKGYELGKSAFKIIQYFSAGIPAVATPVGMNSEVIIDGENGFLPRTSDEWYQAFDLLLRNVDQRLAMGQKGRKTYLQRFTREAAVNAWQSVFNKYLPSVEDTSS